MKLDNFLKDASIMFVATIVSSACAMLYQLFMVRSLDPIDFGVLNTLLSMTIIVSMPTGPLQAVVTRFVATLKAGNNWREISDFLVLFFKKVFVLGIIVFLIFFLFRNKIAGFLKITDNYLIIMFGFLMMFATIQPFNLGGLQGLQKFKSLGLVNIINALARLVFGVILIKFGFKVYGALGAIILSGLLTIIFSFIPLSPYFSSQKRGEKYNFKSVTKRLDLLAVYKSFLPAFIILSSFGLLTNIDIVLVKHFFPEAEAGIYSIAQIFGKIILFLPSAIVMVMFPKLTENHAKKENTTRMLKKGLVVTGLMCFLVSTGFIMFPQLTLKLLTGKAHLDAIPLIAPFSISMSFFALNNVFQYYHLSTHNVKGVYLFLIAVVLQILLICLYHGSLLQVLYVLTGCAALLFFANTVTIKRMIKNEKFAG